MKKGSQPSTEQTKVTGRRLKGVDDYAAENSADFTARSVIRDGQPVRVLVCRFCFQNIRTRSDRIKEHLCSKRHQQHKLWAMLHVKDAAQENQVTQEYLNDSVSGPLYQQLPADLSHYPETGIPLTQSLLKNPKQWSNGEMTVEVEDRTPVKDSLKILNKHIGNVIKSPSLPWGRHHSRGGAFGGSNMALPGPLFKPKAPVLVPPSQKLMCVKWNNFDCNIASMFLKLRSRELFMDVTLGCEGKLIKCHKVVLAAGSPHFEKLLTENPNPHPIILLKDVRYWEIVAIVEFMYSGKVNINQDKIASLFRAATLLGIKGLGFASANETENHFVDHLHEDRNSRARGADSDYSNATIKMTFGEHSYNETPSRLHNQTKNNYSTGENSGLDLAPQENDVNTKNNYSTGENSGLDLAPQENDVNSCQQYEYSSSARMIPSGSIALDFNNKNNNIYQSGGQNAPTKKRKMNNPRRIMISRAGLPLLNSTMGSSRIGDYCPSNDSIAFYVPDNYEQAGPSQIRCIDDGSLGAQKGKVFLKARKRAESEPEEGEKNEDMDDTVVFNAVVVEFETHDQLRTLIRNSTVP